jgi:hypothetical protein
MKRITDTMFRLILPIIFSVTGCLEVSVRTNISADGSSERIITIQSSSKNLPSDVFPMPLDSTWTVTWTDKKDSRDRYTYVARKHFRTPEELMQAYAMPKDSGIVQLHISLRKKFEWFYTYVEYREVYTMKNQFSTVPISAYLFPEQIDSVVYGKSTDSLNRKVDEWNTRNVFEAFYQSLVEEITRRNDSAISVPLLAEKKEELFSRILESEADKKKDVLSTSSAILHLFADVVHNTAILGYRSYAEKQWDRITNAMVKQRTSPSDWKYSVQMPGLLLETNGETVEGNVVQWKFSGDQLHVGDYAMSASSRVTNIWAMVTTGAIGLLCIAVIIFIPVRKRTMLHQR